MRTVRDILNEKGSEVFAITPEASVYQALQLMADKNVGALMVLTGSKVVGLISERDYARKVVLKGRFSRDVPVQEIMSSEIVRIGPEEDVEGCMTLMTHKHIRHLPVFENERLIGLISIGDIVKTIIEHKEETIQQLEKYIKGHR
ncbi:MAG: CBS domain-containing protein [Desulfobacteraceae bacterium]|nr:CBS domain-containing protein [Desulfobacteraceae bacterium]